MHLSNGGPKRTVLAVVLFFFTNSLIAMAQGSPPAVPSPHPTKKTYLQLAGDVEARLHRDVLDVWFPRNIDNQNGGFYSGFDRKWETTPSEGKFSVF